MSCGNLYNDCGSGPVRTWLDIDGSNRDTLSGIGTCTNIHHLCEYETLSRLYLTDCLGTLIYQALSFFRTCSLASHTSSPSEAHREPSYLTPRYITRLYSCILSRHNVEIVD